MGGLGYNIRYFEVKFLIIGVGLICFGLLTKYWANKG
jgi:hypothetical protein